MTGRRALVSVLVASLATLVLVGADVAFDGFAAEALDPLVRDRVLDHVPRELGSVLSVPGGIVLSAGVVATAAVGLAARSGPRPALAAVAGFVALLGLVYGLKEGFARARPGEGADGFAFPSGHAARAAFAYGLGFVVALRRFPGRPERLVVGAAAVVAVAGVAAGRVVLDVHWLTDVVGGVALGAAVLAATLLFAEPRA